MNEPLFAALERSKDSDRLLWGASRPYSMQLLDKTHQESLILERRHDCSCICCCCRAERMFLIIPPGDVVGIIEEEFSLFTTELVMRNSNAEAIYRISIPKKNKFYMPKEKYFKVKDGDNLTEKGSIVRRWNSDLNLYTMIVYFTDPDLNIRLKSLYIGAAFLLVSFDKIYENQFKIIDLCRNTCTSKHRAPVDVRKGLCFLFLQAD